MNYEQKLSNMIKTKALTWLRIKHRCAFIATEVGPFNADVLGISETRIVEVEVKISFQDFKNDFHKHKHYQYTGNQYGSTWDRPWHPTHFYFAMPGEIVDKAVEYLKSKDNKGFSKYGVINADTFEVAKNAQKLHERPSESHPKFVMALRMGSELIRLRSDYV